MREIALVALSGAYLTSAGAVRDAVDLILDRQGRVLAEPAGRAEMRLRLLFPEGVPDDARLLPAEPVLAVDGAYEQFDFIWIPGMRIGSPTMAAARIRGLSALGDWLRRQAHGGALIGASGASVLLLIEFGLLTATRIPVSGSMVPLLDALYPRIGRQENQSILQQGNIYVSSGFGHDIELVARVLERIASPAASAWYRSVAGVERAGLPDLAEDPLVSAAQLRIEQQFAAGMSIADLAADLATSHHTLIRRFRSALGQTPREYLHAQRLAAARRLLAHTTRPVGTIARMVGFSDTRSFRELFRKHTGVSARDYRKQGANVQNDHKDD